MMIVRPAIGSRRMFGVFTLSIAPLLCARVAGGQTYDFGYVPVGATNQANGFNFPGGSYNGTNIFMATEAIIGANASHFRTSTNYAGQTLSPGHLYFYSLSFVPQAIGFKTAALTNYQTP